jgi:acyl-CoA synthetase (AMP-forming)/AMP-acid ligase II
VLEAHFAVPQLGAALVPINVRLSAEEIGYILGHSGAKALILDHDLAPAVASVRADLPELELIVGVDLAARHGGQPPELPAEELIAFARERLAHFKCPRAVEFGPLPKTSTGKIQKFVLRDREWAGYEKRIH